MGRQAASAQGSRVLHIRISTKSEDPQPLFEYLRTAVVFYENLEGTKIRLLRSMDAPSRYIEVVEYNDVDVFNADQERVKSDPEMTELLSTWRSLLHDDVVVEKYEDVTWRIKHQ